MASCKKTIYLANKDWPLFDDTTTGECSYIVRVKNSEEAAKIIIEAENMPNYKGHSDYNELPDNEILFYIYIHCE